MSEPVTTKKKFFEKSFFWNVTICIFVIGLTLRIYREYETIKKYPVNSWTEDLRADCAIVLTGGPFRVREGFDLLAQKKVLKLIISGVHSTTKLHELFSLKPIYGHIDERDVILEKQSQTTFGNAVQSLQLAEALRCRDLLLVTSSLHTYRALMTFRKEFPPEMRIMPYSVYTSYTGFSGSYEVFVEAFKSYFYSFWAY